MVTRSGAQGPGCGSGRCCACGDPHGRQSAGRTASGEWMMSGELQQGQPVPRTGHAPLAHRMGRDVRRTAVFTAAGSLMSAYRRKYVNGIRQKENQVERMISNAELNALLRLHPHPIDVVVCHDPSGKTYLGMGLALRCFQRLSLPHLAAQRCL